MKYPEYAVVYESKKGLVEYDSTSNRPFIVYKKTETELDRWSGEDEKTSEEDDEI